MALGAAAAAVECSCARYCLATGASVLIVLVALEQSNDRGPGSFCLRCIKHENLLMLPRSSAARAVRSSKKPATTGVRVVLESSVARVLLGVAASAACC